MAEKRPRKGNNPKKNEHRLAQSPRSDQVDPIGPKKVPGDKTMPSAMHEAPSKLLNESANLFSLLSDESRLRIVVDLIQCGELNVGEISERLNQTQPAISHHLALLRVSGVVEARRAGKHIYYSASTEQFSDLLYRLLSSLGEMPRSLRFHDFRLTHSGR
jgi:ArsR family transcriptional regulator